LANSFMMKVFSFWS